MPKGVRFSPVAPAPQAYPLRFDPKCGFPLVSFSSFVGRMVVLRVSLPCSFGCRFASQDVHQPAGLKLLSQLWQFRGLLLRSRDSSPSLRSTAAARGCAQNQDSWAHRLPALVVSKRPTLLSEFAMAH